MLTTDHKKLQLVVSIALINDNRDQILISKRPEKKVFVRLLGISWWQS